MSEEKYMIDSMGDRVPVRHVQSYDRVRDAAVRRIVARFTLERQRLERLMADSLADLNKVAKARGEAGIDLSAKGNIQVSSFDGLQTVSIRVRYDIRLDDRATKARDLMYACARRKADQVEDGEVLILLIDEAFRPTRSGSLPVARVLSLMRKDVSDPDWREAKRLLSESISTSRGKSYLCVDVRPDRQHDPVPVRLDISDCWPETKEVQP